MGWHQHTEITSGHQTDGYLRQALESEKNLGRQNELEEVLVKSHNVGFRATPKATADHALLTPVLQLLSPGLPLWGPMGLAVACVP